MHHTTPARQTAWGWHVGSCAAVLAVVLLAAPLLGQSTGAAPAESAAAEPAVQGASDWMEQVDDFFGTYLVKPLDTVLFFDFWTGRILGEGRSVPFVVVWLMLGAAFFTLRMGFINIRGFWHAPARHQGRLRQSGRHRRGDALSGLNVRVVRHDRSGQHCRRGHRRGDRRTGRHFLADYCRLAGHDQQVHRVHAGTDIPSCRSGRHRIGWADAISA